MISMSEVYREYADAVYKYLLLLSGSKDTAEELTQETFYRAIKNVNKYDYSCEILTWLCAIGKNALSEYKRKKLDYEELREDSVVIEGPEKIVFANYDRERICKAINTLDDVQKKIVVLRLFEELSFRKIGLIFDKSEEWARVNYYRGKRKLQEELKNE